VALAGDAAHAMAPSAAQGGAQAIEDAWVLSAMLSRSSSDPAAALTHYERARRPRVERLAKASRRNLMIYDLKGLPAAIRNVVLRTLPASLYRSQLDWIFGWKPQ
jgi:salicylate hydroxylase